ncbi:cbdddd60-c9a9-4bf9-86a1-a2556273d9df-CDS [Sclerotinia trifoliorum]|uniref:Cbdddd60-c9a9-4bf9-86a1-a2556273d9df-CDS n=1 Tax=Sclerotinia trifoliorum TaxID=28548 RepID=A0A8H2VY44_9HELO|nr:cbdddd60-c9a9-4bf9-86a1-a2556273d9df-CDS [Sclerotinia trifoliorum]
MASQCSSLRDAPRVPELSMLSINVFYAQKDTNIKRCRSNCRSIEVDIFYPLDYNFSENPSTDMESGEIMDGKYPCLSSADALTPFEHSSHEFSSSPITSTSGKSHFPFLSLPIEIRLKIYLLLLPPRHHKITTQIPHNGYYFPPTCIPARAAQSFYPISPDNPERLTTYKILSANSHVDFPNPSIHTRILSVCQKIQEEAEEVLYGNENSIWDFGMNIEAVNTFWSDRSQVARAWVRNLKIAREISELKIFLGIDVIWENLCELITREFSGLRCLDLTVWGGTGEKSFLENLYSSDTMQSFSLGDDDEGKRSIGNLRNRRNLHEWDYTRKLLAHEGFRSAKVTWWEFRTGAKTFMAKWMLENRLWTEDMIREGAVVQDVVIWNSGKF